MALNSGDRSIQLLATTITLLVITTLAVVLRLIARRISKVGLWLDDWFIVFALVAFTSNCACVLILQKDGLGRHMSTVSFDPDIFQKATWSTEFAYQLTVCSYKISLVLFYYRLFALSRFRTALHLTGGLISIYTVWSILQTLLQCIPIEAKLRRPAPHAGDICIPARAYLLSLSIPNVILDWALLFLPIPIIWTLKMSLVYKVEISAVMGIGALVCVISIIRMIKASSVSQTDITWNFTPLTIWSMLEMSIGIICPCLVTLRPILRSIFGKTYHNRGSTMPRNIAESAAPGPFQRMQQSSDDYEARLAYHTTIDQGSFLRSESNISLAGIRVAKDVNVESRVARL